MGFQPRVGQTLLQNWGSGHVPIAVATDSMLDRGLQIDAQGSSKRRAAPELLDPLGGRRRAFAAVWGRHPLPNLGTRPAPLFPVAHGERAGKEGQVFNLKPPFQPQRSADLRGRPAAPGNLT